MCSADNPILDKIPYILSFLLFVGFIASSAGYIATTQDPYYSGAIFMVIVGIFGTLIICACKDSTLPGYTRDPLLDKNFEARPQYIYSVNKPSEKNTMEV